MILLKQLWSQILLIVVFGFIVYGVGAKYFNSLSIFNEKEKQLKEKIKSIQVETKRLEKINKKYKSELSNLKNRIKELDKKDKSIRRGVDMDDAVNEFFK